jgi:hypothetical protein
MDDKMKLRLKTTAQGGLIGLVIAGAIGLVVDELWIAIPGALLMAYVGWCVVPD